MSVCLAGRGAGGNDVPDLLTQGEVLRKCVGK